MALGKIAKILVGDRKPAFRRVRFNLVTDYKMGSGWGFAGRFASANFRDAMVNFFGSNGWAVRLPEDSYTCVTVRKNGQYLYLHPMEITGYIKEESLEELRTILSFVPEDVLHGFDEGRLGEEVYSLSDGDIVNLFREHKAEIWSILSSALAKHEGKPIEWVVWDYVSSEAIIPRDNETSGGGRSSSDIENVLLINEAASLLLARERGASVA